MHRTSQINSLRHQGHRQQGHRQRPLFGRLGLICRLPAARWSTHSAKEFPSLQVFQLLGPALELPAQARHNVPHLPTSKAVDLGHWPNPVERRLDEVLRGQIQHWKERY